MGCKETKPLNPEETLVVENLQSITKALNMSDEIAYQCSCKIARAFMEKLDADKSNTLSKSEAKELMI